MLKEGILLFYISKQSVANLHFDIRYSLFDIQIISSVNVIRNTHGVECG